MRQLKIDQKFTSRDSLSLERYLSEVSKIPLLSPDEEAELAALIREGDQDALEKLTRANLRFVISVAKQYQNQGLSLSDLINEGNIGLIRAARRFDESRGFKFISYAVWWIRQSILKAIVEYSRIVRFPSNKVAAYNKLAQVYNSFFQEHKRKPSVDELADITGLPYEQIIVLLRVSNRHLSFDSPVSKADDDTTMLDLYVQENPIETDDDLIKDSIREEIVRSLSVLSNREKEVLKLHYGLNGEKSLSLNEIADRFSLSKERVRQIRERALRKMRRSYKKNSLVS